LGLFEAIPTTELLKNTDPEDRDRDGVSGRLRMVGSSVGRFGWKAQSGSVKDFVDTALEIEMGLTVHDGAEEVSKEDRRALVEFVRLLAPPPARPLGPSAERGCKVFSSAGCASCHVPALQTSGGPAAKARRVEAYSDLLLHEMGSDLSDDFSAEGVAAGEFRTAPLWGVSYVGPPYLHDGRAGSLDAAILAHGGEAAAARDAYRELSAEDRAALLRFLDEL
jgi:CxxC motif-containing protein (DUF1111 family)